jgi:hypothetical protein
MLMPILKELFSEEKLWILTGSLALVASVLLGYPMPFSHTLPNG